MDLVTPYAREAAWLLTRLVESNYLRMPLSKCEVLGETCSALQAHHLLQGISDPRAFLQAGLAEAARLRSPTA